MKKTKACLVLYGLCLNLCFGQEVIGSQGGTYSNSESIVDFTIGETLIESYSTNDLFVSQGFLQPVVEETITSTLIDNRSNPISIYPNPTSDIVRLELTHYDGLHYRIHDLTGRLVLQSTLHNQLTEINVSDLDEGAYQLSLINLNDNTINGYLIIKK